VEVRQVATEALKFLLEAGSKNAMPSVHRSALMGFFAGVADGSITIGQDWPVSVLLGKNIDIISDKQYDVVEQVFRSGMCCQGQPLAALPSKSFTARSSAKH
jgi:hypothetical protein